MDKRDVMDWEFRHASELARASWLFQRVADAARAGARAWDGSRIVHVTKASADGLSRVPIAGRLRIVGLLLLIAAATHAILLLFIPQQLTPVVPFGAALLVAGAAIALVVTSPGVAAAWEARRRRDVS